LAARVGGNNLSVWSWSREQLFRWFSQTGIRSRLLPGPFTRISSWASARGCCGSYFRGLRSLRGSLISLIGIWILSLVREALNKVRIVLPPWTVCWFRGERRLWGPALSGLSGLTMLEPFNVSR